MPRTFFVEVKRNARLQPYDWRTPKDDVFTRHENHREMIFQLSYHGNTGIEYLSENEPLNCVRAWFAKLKNQKKAEKDAALASRR